LSRDETLN